MKQFPIPPTRGYCWQCTRYTTLTRGELVTHPAETVVDHTEYEEGGHAPHVSQPYTAIRPLCPECRVGGA
jgi:hypothetical protein